MKKRIGKLYGKPIIIGDKNLDTVNETHITELSGSKESIGAEVPYNIRWDKAYKVSIDKLIQKCRTENPSATPEEVAAEVEGSLGALQSYSFMGYTYTGGGHIYPFIIYSLFGISINLNSNYSRQDCAYPGFVILRSFSKFENQSGLTDGFISELLEVYGDALEPATNEELQSFVDSINTNFGTNYKVGE